MQMKVEIDIFREKPDADLNCNETTANDSAMTKVFRKKHKMYEALMGDRISHVLGKALEENITKALAFEKSEDGYRYSVILGWGNVEIEKFKIKECDSVLSTLGFPCNGLWRKS